LELGGGSVADIGDEPSRTGKRTTVFEKIGNSSRMLAFTHMPRLTGILQ